jgi:hypothetical protein
MPFSHPELATGHGCRVKPCASHTPRGPPCAYSQRPPRPAPYRRRSYSAGHRDPRVATPSLGSECPGNLRLSPHPCHPTASTTRFCNRHVPESKAMAEQGIRDFRRPLGRRLDQREGAVAGLGVFPGSNPAPPACRSPSCPPSAPRFPPRSALSLPRWRGARGGA